MFFAQEYWVLMTFFSGVLSFIPLGKGLRMFSSLIYRGAFSFSRYLIGGKTFLKLYKNYLHPLYHPRWDVCILTCFNGFKHTKATDSKSLLWHLDIYNLKCGLYSNQIIYIYTLKIAPILTLTKKAFHICYPGSLIAWSSFNCTSCYDPSRDRIFTSLWMNK